MDRGLLTALHQESLHQMQLLIVSSPAGVIIKFGLDVAGASIYDDSRGDFSSVYC